MNRSAVEIALEQIDSSVAKERNDGLNDLKRIFRQKGRATSHDSSNDFPLPSTIERIERVIVSDKAAYQKALSSNSKTVKSTAAFRLTGSFATLRLLIEVSVKDLRWKPIRGLLNWLTDVFTGEHGVPCEPIALDAAKSINEILSYRPHLDHLTTKEREYLFGFCLSTLDRLANESAISSNGNESPLVPRGFSASSTTHHGSTRSYEWSSATSPAHRHLTFEIGRTLQLLTSSPASIATQTAESTLTGILQFLGSSGPLSNVEGVMITSLRNILRKERLEVVTFLRKMILPLISLVDNLWVRVPSRSIGIRDHLIDIILLADPYVRSELRTGEKSVGLLRATQNLLETILGDCYSRPLKDQLSLDDIRLSVEEGVSLSGPSSSTQRKWASLRVIATLLHTITPSSDDTRTASIDRSSNGKRCRQSNVYDELRIIGRRSGKPSSFFAFQVIVVYTQIFSCSAGGLMSLLEFVMPHLIDEDRTAASWALVCLASIANQYAYNPEDSLDHWTSAWDTASRAVTVPSSSRAACFLMTILEQRGLARPRALDTLTRDWESMMDVRGPASFEECSIALVASVLRYCQLHRPVAFADMATTILAWAFKTWDPGATKIVPSASLQDVLDLLTSCLQAPRAAVIGTLPPIAHDVFFWNTGPAGSGPLDYILGLDKDDTPSLKQQVKPISKRAKTDRAGQPSVTAVLSNLFVTHGKQILSQWTQLTRNTRHQEILLHTTLLMAKVGYHCSAGLSDDHNLEATTISQITSQLYSNLLTCVGAPDFAAERLDAHAGLIFSQVVKARETPASIATPVAGHAALLYLTAKKLASRETSNAAAFDDDDLVMDDSFEVAVGTRSSKGGTQVSEHENKTNDHVMHEQISCARLFSKLVDPEHASRSSNSDGSNVFISELGNMSASDIIAGRHVILNLSTFGVALQEHLVYSILDILSDTVLKTYEEERCDDGFQTVLRFLLKSFDTWINPSTAELRGLSLDLYEFFVSAALSQDALSFDSQKLFTDLLIRIWQRNGDFGQSEESPPISVRTALFQLVAKGTVSLNMYQGQVMDVIFSYFTATNHDILFDDLLSNLAIDADWLEGIAVRLYFLARLGARWPTLLRKAVYHIFDAAGQIPSCMGLACSAISEIVSSHRFSNGKYLFRSFCSQLIYTWMTEHELSEMPFQIFGYESLKELVLDNADETAAQCFLSDRHSELNLINELIETTSVELVRTRFSSSFAYIIAHDIAGDGSKQHLEANVKDLFPSKTEYVTLVREKLPEITTKILLSTSVDAGLYRSLEKKPALSYAASGLQQMLNFASDTSSQPPASQPAFRGRHLVETFERVARRAGITFNDLFRCAPFTACVRGLVDSQIPQLGSIHTRAILQRLRILCALGKESLRFRYPAELILRTVWRLLLDDACADDAVGVAHFVFDQQVRMLDTQSSWLAGSILYTLATLQTAALTQHDPLTQDSQRKRIISHHDRLRTWLIQFATGMEVHDGDPSMSMFRRLIRLCCQVRYPTNLIDDTNAVEYLLLLLDDESGAKPLLTKEYREGLICLVLQHSDRPKSGGKTSVQDISRHAGRLWQYAKCIEVPASTRSWLGAVVGTTYAFNGRHTLEMGLSKPEGQDHASKASFDDAVLASQAIIIDHLVSLLWSEHSVMASAAESALRQLTSFSSTRGNTTLLQLIPRHVFEALSLDFPTNTVQSVNRDLNAATTKMETAEKWIIDLSEQMIVQADGDSLLSALRPIIRFADFTAKVLGSLAHLFLASESAASEDRRKWLSKALRDAFVQIPSVPVETTTRLLEVVTYLLNQPMRTEKTRAERFNWLNVDFLIVINKALDAGAPTHALYFSESLPKIKPSSSRSARKSFGQCDTLVSDVSLDVLRSIYDAIGERDTVYCAERPPSMLSVLRKSDLEDDAFKSLVLHSACLDASFMMGSPDYVEHTAQMVKALGKMQLDSLVRQLVNQSRQFTDSGGDRSALSPAQRLYEWDIGVPESSHIASVTLFTAFQGLDNSSTVADFRPELEMATAQVVNTAMATATSSSENDDLLQCLALITDIQSLMSCHDLPSLRSIQVRGNASNGDHLSERRPESHHLVTQRQVMFGVLRRNHALQADLNLSLKDCLLAEVESVLMALNIANETTKWPGSLTAAVYLSNLVTLCDSVGLSIDARAKLELATVLWDRNETETSIRILRELASRTDLDQQSIPVGKAGLLAQLGSQIADARLERPEEIATAYLTPALKSLGKHSTNSEAGKVYHTFATFCDSQLQNSESLADFERLKASRERRMAEKKQLEKIYHETPSTNKEARSEIVRSVKKTKQWLELDNVECQRMQSARDDFIQQSLTNYLRALAVTERYDMEIDRFFALWLEHDQSAGANKAIEAALNDVPSWKFVTLLTQMMSRLLDDGSKFQSLLSGLTSRVCADHPYHSIYQLFASSNSAVGKDDTVAKSRRSAAKKIAESLRGSKTIGPLFNKVWEANSLYDDLANTKVDPGRSSRMSIRSVPKALLMNKRVAELAIPPATLHLELRRAADYGQVPTIVRFRDEVTIAGGISAPKILTARATDGNQYKQLFKGGNDDLRQDAIMEQVFASVSSMLRNHPATRKRNLHIRTYTVLPLSSTSGIIEFVPNSIPLQEWLAEAHKNYHPTDLRWNKAREIIRAAQDSPKEQRVATYRSVAKQYQPVLRHFFFERFTQPDTWFAARLAYTRSTAAISILGHALGLGDRHCHNILLDERTGEVIHIDLGVAFEAGRVLPVPEVVPFRLTRDIVDGFGISGVEGPFRRCAEAVLDALVAHKRAILTRLDVLRYDPLYSWSISPLRARRMQTEAAAEAAGGGGVSAVAGTTATKGPVHEAAEAERALATVERKLSPSLSARAAVNELIQTASDERNLAVLFAGWAAFS